METIQMEDKAPEEPKLSKTKSKIITIVTITLVVLFIVGLCLAIVLPGSVDNDEVVVTTTTQITPQHIDKNNRIDCVPWAKNDSSYNLQTLCKSYSYCRYDSIDGNVNVPSCYIDKSKLAVNLISSEDTSLGKSFLVDTNFGRAAVNKLRIDFEFWDDNTLRFKVYS